MPGTGGQPYGLQSGRDEMLSAVKPGIDGPLAGPDQRRADIDRVNASGADGSPLLTPEA